MVEKMVMENIGRRMELFMKEIGKMGSELVTDYWNARQAIFIQGSGLKTKNMVKAFSSHP